MAACETPGCPLLHAPDWLITDSFDAFRRRAPIPLLARENHGIGNLLVTAGWASVPTVRHRYGVREPLRSAVKAAGQSLVTDQLRALINPLHVTRCGAAVPLLRRQMALGPTSQIRAHRAPTTLCDVSRSGLPLMPALQAAGSMGLQRPKWLIPDPLDAQQRSAVIPLLTAYWSIRRTSRTPTASRDAEGDNAPLVAAGRTLCCMFGARSDGFVADPSDALDSGAAAPLFGRQGNGIGALLVGA